MKKTVVLITFLFFSVAGIAADEDYTSKSSRLAKEAISDARKGKTSDAYEKMSHSTEHFINGVQEEIKGNGTKSDCNGCWDKKPRSSGKKTVIPM